MTGFEFILQFPKWLISLSRNIMAFASTEVFVVGIGNVSLISIISGGAIAIILTIKLIQWLIKG